MKISETLLDELPVIGGAELDIYIGTGRPVIVHCTPLNYLEISELSRFPYGQSTITIKGGNKQFHASVHGYGALWNAYKIQIERNTQDEN